MQASLALPAASQRGSSQQLEPWTMPFPAEKKQVDGGLAYVCRQSLVSVAVSVG